MRLRSTLLLASMALAASSTSCGETSREAPAGEPNRVSLDGEEGEDYEGLIHGKADGVDFSNTPLTFDRACEPGEQITIAAVGDVLLHGKLQRQAYSNSQGFISLWAGVRDLLEAGDVTYANLEGPTATGVNAYGRAVADPGRTFDGVVYSSYPQFNYHASLVDDLLASGIDVVSTANNHALDRRALGVDRTLEALEARGMPWTGTRRQGDTSSEWATFTEQGGFKLAWLACTYATNGIPDNAHQVLGCFSEADTIETIITGLAARTDVDAVIVTPHWGVEYKATPQSSQIELAHRFLEAGATAIIGSHPHVLEPWERYVTDDGRETFVIYSLGNFVSGQRHLPRRSSLLLYLGLTRFADGSVGVNGVRYVPLHVDDRDGMILAEAIDRVGGFADSRALTVGMFGQWNVHVPSTAVTTNPQCDPDWQPPTAPHPSQGWIGGACSADLACGGATCLTGQPDGLCTELCDRTCPDRAGRPTTFCVDLGFDNSGVCVLQCSSSAECRDGYACVSSPRYNDAQTLRTVCLPVTD